MIDSAEEFIRLRKSELQEEYNRAAHDEAPMTVWLELVQKHPEMKVWVVHNKTVPLEILEALSLDEDPKVRSSVARKRKASHEIMERLARDTDESVRHGVACNKKTPPTILKLLLDDDSAFVATKANSRLSEIG